MVRRRLTPILLCALFVTAVATSASAQTAPDAAAMAAYRAKLAAWERVHGPYARVADAYWDQVSDKRKIRNAKRRAHEAMTLDDPPQQVEVQA